MMRIHTAKTSPAGKRVRICAAELGVELEPLFLDIPNNEQRSPGYLAMNPMGKFPTLLDGDLVLWESAAILCHLAQTSPNGDKLYPRDPMRQADTLRWLFFGACHLDAYFTMLVVERFIKARQGLPPDEAVVASAGQSLARFMPVVDQQLARREYLTGAFSLADIALGCTLELTSLVRYDDTPLPNVRAWLERLHARGSWRGASPEAFPQAVA
ncbi:MAG TPA: glutathione S-transferase family protein [Polyangiaceae bacterium]|jgi:glutathione S-transferase|nr:glutathione S-transferase family protein [Polyangiaceae bacterium]